MKNTQKLSGKITDAFAASMGSRPAAKDIGFHMTDWDDDVDDLIRLYENPDAFTNDETVDLVLRFLAHVPNHVAAAKKLAGLGPIEDVFGVGVLVEDAD
jgi:hypothetical protein